MDVVHAISKVRFATARPQRVRLSRNDAYVVEMLCMEAGQEIDATAGPWTYYVVMGTARLTAGASAGDVAAGQIAATEPDEHHTLANAGEGRLVCLAIAPAQ